MSKVDLEYPVSKKKLFFVFSVMLRLLTVGIMSGGEE